MIGIYELFSVLYSAYNSVMLWENLQYAYVYSKTMSSFHLCLVFISICLALNSPTSFDDPYIMALCTALGLKYGFLQAASLMYCLLTRHHYPYIILPLIFYTWRVCSNLIFKFLYVTIVLECILHLAFVYSNLGYVSW